ncbi:hypothetical protein CJU90_0219 [Yarrowia sp. C11]|nr:hypothetical protein CKK34_1632 [Yarrowia sp. E02]KAG5372572.1 hypothetical protein CJU90_0219 [Yarrowia sp. C11]
MLRIASRPLVNTARSVRMTQTLRNHSTQTTQSSSTLLLTYIGLAFAGAFVWPLKESLRMTTEQAAALEKKEIRENATPNVPGGVPLDDVALAQEGNIQAAEAPGNLADYDKVEPEEDVPMPKNVPLDDVALKEHGDVKAAMAPGDN